MHVRDALARRRTRLADDHELGPKEAVDGLSECDEIRVVADIESRPGLAAAKRHGVRSPLLDAGLSKPWVRAVSRAMGLPTWDKPSESCLSSRFPYGTDITKDGLARVAAAERVVKDLGFRTVRVRVHDPVARIEVPAADLEALLAPGIRERVVDGLKSLGFAYVALDLEGFRSGSMNEPLRPVPRASEVARPGAADLSSAGGPTASATRAHPRD